MYAIAHVWRLKDSFRCQAFSVPCLRQGFPLLFSAACGRLAALWTSRNSTLPLLLMGALGLQTHHYRGWLYIGAGI